MEPKLGGQIGVFGPDNQVWTSGMLAKHFGVSPWWVRKQIRLGVIKTLKRWERGSHYRIPGSEVARLEAEVRLPRGRFTIRQLHEEYDRIWDKESSQLNPLENPLCGSLYLSGTSQLLDGDGIRAMGGVSASGPLPGSPGGESEKGKHQHRQEDPKAPRRLGLPLPLDRFH